MAGSLNHIVDDHGALTLWNIENMRDAGQALTECFDLIALLLVEGNISAEQWDAICECAKAPVPKLRPIFGMRAE